MPRSAPRTRFAFRILEGPNAGLASGGWRVWVSKEDTYIAAAGVGQVWKTSLHGDVAWQCAVTSEHMAADNRVWAGPDRVGWRFQPTQFENGQRIMFAILTNRLVLRPQPIDPREKVIEVGDCWNETWIASVYQTEPGVELNTSRQLIAPPLTLDSGRRVWVTAHAEEMPDSQDRTPPDVLIMKVLTQEDYPDIPSPGYQLVGAAFTQESPEG